MKVDRSRLPVVGSDSLFTFPRIQRHRLSNGLDVRTAEHHTVPLVTFVLQVGNGSGSDPFDKEGLAALTADMLDEGTGALSAIDISEAMARIGAEFDIEAGADATAVTLTTLTRFVDRGAALLADLAARPSLREEDFDRVRQLRLDRLRQLRDLPAAVAERAFLRLLYGPHPYGHLSIGNEQALRAMGIDDVRGFHAAAFSPSRATLVVVGDLTHEELRDAAERAFGGWPATAADGARGAGPADIDPAVLPSTRLAIIPRERAAQSHLRIGHLSARRTSPDYPALLVMNAVLGGAFVSRVNLKLREEKGYTYGARTGFDWRRGISPFSLEASVDTLSTADAIRDSLAELGAILGERPANPRELTLAKATLTRGYPRNFETAQQVARSIGQFVLYDLPDTYFEAFVPKIHAISSDDVTRAAHTHLDPSRLATLVVGDRAAIADAVGALNLGEPVILSSEG